MVAFIGAGYFAPKAEACTDLWISRLQIPFHIHMGPTGEWIQKIRDYESRIKRTPIERSINNAC